jgi:hypothetical protein
LQQLQQRFASTDHGKAPQWGPQWPQAAAPRPPYAPAPSAVAPIAAWQCAAATPSAPPPLRQSHAVLHQQSWPRAHPPPHANQTHAWAPQWAPQGMAPPAAPPPRLNAQQGALGQQPTSSPWQSLFGHQHGVHMFVGAPPPVGGAAPAAAPLTTPPMPQPATQRTLRSCPVCGESFAAPTAANGALCAACERAVNF